MVIRKHEEVDANVIRFAYPALNCEAATVNGDAPGQHMGELNALRFKMQMLYEYIADFLPSIIQMT